MFLTPQGRTDKKEEIVEGGGFRSRKRTIRSTALMSTICRSTIQGHRSRTLIWTFMGREELERSSNEARGAEVSMKSKNLPKKKRKQQSLAELE